MLRAAGRTVRPSVDRSTLSIFVPSFLPSLPLSSQPHAQAAQSMWMLVFKCRFFCFHFPTWLVLWCVFCGSFTFTLRVRFGGAGVAPPVCLISFLFFLFCPARQVVFIRLHERSDDPPCVDVLVFLSKLVAVLLRTLGATAFPKYVMVENREMLRSTLCFGTLDLVFGCNHVFQRFKHAAAHNHRCLVWPAGVGEGTWRKGS